MLELCRRIMVEEDHDRMIGLVRELNALLDVRGNQFRPAPPASTEEVIAND
jgi:hypothetical protein